MNITFADLSKEIKPLLLLALPLMLSELVDASFTFTATLLSAHLGVLELAAGGLVTTVFITIMIFMWGILVTVSTLIAQQHGANNSEGISRVLKDGLILATIFSIPGTLLVWHMAPILLYFGQNSETVLIAEHYLHALAWAVIADFWAVVLLQFVIGLGRTRLALLFNAVKVPVTLVISYTCMYGQWGMPRLGLAGLGWGITAGMWIATLLLLAYILLKKELRFYLIKHTTTQKHYLLEILQTGLPIAGMFCIEVGYFSMISLIMGRISSTVLAASQIVSQFTGFFTVVISFVYAQAVGIRISHALGRRDLSVSMRTTYAGLVIACGFMLIVACCYWFMPNLLISIDVGPDIIQYKEIQSYASQFFIAAGFVQLFESARIVLFGSLRGLSETRFSMLTSLIIFWLIALPVGLFLTFKIGLGGVGMWMGMALGALSGAILLFWWLQRTLQRHYHRL